MKTKQIKIPLLLGSILIFFLFSAVKVNALDPALDCERRADGIHITMRLMFWQNSFTGGDTALETQVANNYLPYLEGRYNGHDVAGVPVFFHFNVDVADSADFPVIADPERNWEENFHSDPSGAEITLSLRVF